MKKWMRTIGTALAVLIAWPVIPVLGGKAEAAAQTVYDLTISDVDQQTVKGWGVFPSWNRADWNRDFTGKTGAHQALFEDLGATMYRITVPHRAGDADGNLVEIGMQEIYTIIDIAKQRGMEDYIMSVWSPPIGMKTLPTVNGWTGTEHVRLRPEKEGAYTDYLVKVIQDLIARGASVPKALSFQNEPLSQIISEWCYWGGDNGTQYQRVAKMLRSKLDAAGFEEVLILGPEGAAYYENELLLGQDFSALSNDAALYDAIDGLASHSYFARGYDNDTSYKAYADVVKLFPEKDKWQTEYSTLIEGISEMDMAINVAQRLSSDMALIQNNYWFWWLGWALNRQPTDVGEVLLDGDGVTVTKSKAFYVLSNIFNNVPVGSKVRRISADPASGLVTDDAVWMDAVAFVNGTKTVALIANPQGETKTVNLKGLTGTTAEAYQLTSAVPLGEDMTLAASRNVQGGTAQDIVLPAKSVTVVITSDTDTAPPHVTFDQSDSTSASDAGYAVRESQFTVSGRLDEAGTLQINGQPITVGADLSFSTTVTLTPGDNTITAVATDTLGNEGPPVELFIRHDPAYLGVTIEQGALTYTRQSAFTVTGRTNGSGTVTLKHERGGATVSKETFQVGSPEEGGGEGGGGHPAGELIRKIFDDNYVLTAYNLTAANGGFSTIDTGAQVVRDAATTFATAEGAYSLRLKLPLGFSRVGFSFLNASNQASPEDLSSVRTEGALQFWVYTVRKEDSLSAVLASNYNGTYVEARLPLGNYLSEDDYGAKWTQVSIPLADFDAAARFGEDGQTTDTSIAWNAVKGFGFSSQTAAYYDPHVDDVKLAYIGGDTEPDPTPDPDPSLTSLEFSADLNLLVGNNTVTASAYNGLGQQAAPATIQVVYDPDPPVLTVPSEGTTEGTSYVLNGSVNESAVVTVNGVAATLRPDLTFTAVVPVSKGANAIAVVATDPAGNVAQAVVNVESNPVDDGALTPGVTAASPAASAPAIDGDLSEAGWVVNNRVEKMVTGTSDNNLMFGTMWDEDNLYVAVKVLDADLKNDSEQAYQDDSVEIYVDGNNGRSGTYETDDHQITLGWQDSALAVGGGIEGIQYAQQNIAGGFSVEFAIPWTGIGVEPPEAGSVIGFDVAYNDDDGNNGGNRESQLMWRGNGDNWRSTAAFGSLILNDGKNVSVALTPSGALTVDGALDEPYWALRSNVKKNLTGTSNNSVSFGTLSDIQNLYVGVRVLDTELRNDSEQNYQDDSVEIYLDADRNQGTTYDAKDNQIIVRWHDDQLFMLGELENVQFAQTDINGGFTVEIAIPWESLGVTPYRDMMLGLDVGNNDDDGQNGGNRESQLMWNGTANNWRDTSGFGNLLNHNLSLSLPDDSEPEPEGLLEFTDNAAALDTLYAKSESIIIATGYPENYNGDADRMTHRIDNPTTPEFVVYQSPEGDIYSFDITTGLFSNTPQFTFYGSADGVNFSKITAKSTLTGGSAGHSVYSNTASGLPEGTKYLKIQFPGLENWKEQLLNVTFKYFGDTTTPPDDETTVEFIDDAVDLTKLHAKSTNVKQATRTGSLDKWGGDGTQFYHSNDDAMEPESIVYQSPEGEIRSFDITVTDWTGLPDSPTYTVFGSEDGTNFTQIPITLEILSTNSGYDTIRIAKDGLAGGYTYLKVVFPYGNAIFDNWTSTINKVTFDYVVAGEPDPGSDPVSATAVLTGPSSAASGQTFDVIIGLTDVEGSIAAEDLVVTYDPELLEFKSAVELIDGYGIAGQTAGTGTLRLILAGSGVENAIEEDGDVLKLGFTVKLTAPTGSASVSVTDHVITNSVGQETQVADASRSLQIVSVDKSELTELLSEAQSLHDAAVEGTKPGEYQAGSKAALLSAIQTAQIVANSTSVTQEQVDLAEQALQAAIETFESSVIQRGDQNGDGSFSVGDLGIVVAYYGKGSADPDWDDYEAADMDQNGTIDIVDLAMLASLILD